MKLNRLFILFIVISLIIPSAGAESLFSLLATSTPIPAVTPGPAVTREPVVYTGGLFDQLATAIPTTAPTLTPAPTAAPTPAPTAAPNDSVLFLGLGYGDYAGKEADSTVENQKEGTLEFIYEQVSANDFQGYGVFLESKGCQTEKMNADSETVVSYVIYNSEMDFGFLLIYQSDRQTLSLAYFPMDEDDIDQPPPVSTDIPKAVDEARVCPDCNQGRCTICDGRGYNDCKLCLGLGICGVCFGRPRTYIPGYGGVGTGTYVTCKGCNGSGRCAYCGSTGKQTCQWCDNGICRTCHGDYMNYR